MGGWRDEGWGDGGKRRWRDVKMEKRKIEGWEDEGMEGWRDRRMKGWKDGGMKG